MRGDIMANAGSIVASLIVNADGAIAGFNAGTEAAKKAANSIGGSIARINSKQINAAATNLLKNFVSPAVLAGAGASLLSDLVKGFSTGSTKTWEQAGMNIMTSLNKGLQSIPIVGEFGKLGETIGNAFFGVDKANASIAQTEIQIAKVDAALKQLKSTADLTLSAEAKIRKDTRQLNLTADQKELEDYQDKLDAELDLQLAAQLAQFDSTKGPEKQIQVARTTTFRGGATSNTLIDNPLYDQQMEERVQARARVEKKIRADLETTFDIESSKVVDAQRERAKAVKDEADFQKGLAEDIRLADEGYDEWKKQSDAEELARTKLLARVEKDLADERSDALDAAVKAYDAYGDAQANFGNTVDDIKRKGAEDAKNQNVTTGLQTAIGAVKVAGAQDFSVQKQIDLAKDALAESKRQSDLLKKISENLQPGKVT